ncbi:30S ribosomal protein S1 [Sulfurimonas sp. MAG313]|nr:30S ribosomal protein S1 [Sulfurimonas sp. MAG313]MDF1881531.1 30S ribosomal protein S1 [Sulfurimonas sp. MAG313]
MAQELEPMEEENFAAMFEASEKRSEESNRVADGIIVEIQEDKALVDVGEKLEGILYLNEIQDESGELTYKVNDSIKVMITGFRNERPRISHKKVLEQLKTLEFITAHKDDYEDLIVEPTVTKKNRGGYILELDGVAFFMPKSLAALKDDDNVIGRKVKAAVIKIDEAESSIVLSRRKLLNEDRKKRKLIIDALMEEDVVVEGTIKKITSYGMFVDVGGVDGLVHYNEISYKGPVNPSKYYKEGDVVECKAISYDKDKRHLSLSIKAVMSDPWEEVESELDEGDTITVTVSNVEPYGVFVDLGNDIEGFLHVSEITWDKNIKSPKDYLEVGAEIDVEVIEIDPQKHKLRVSLKTLLPKPFDEFIKVSKEGDIITGTVTTLTDFGAFVRVGTVEGLLHNQDCTWDKSSKAKEIYSVGDEVEVKIVKINREEEKISLNRKALLESPVDKFAKENKVNDIVKGKVRDVKDFGVFVSLEGDMDALIRNEDLEPLIAEELNPGDEIEAAIAVIDVKRDRIRLSVKKLQRLQDQVILAEHNAQNDEGNSLGDLIKDKLK